MQKGTAMDNLFTSTPDDLEHASEEENRRAREYADEQQVREEFRGEKRLPVEFILDTSGSMQENGKIDELNEGIVAFIEAIINKDETTGCVDVGVITMGGIKPEIVAPLETVHDYKKERVYEADGYTLVGEALQMAVSEVTSRKLFYRNNNIQYYRPLIIMLSDGYPTDNEGYVIRDEQVIQQYVDFVKEKTDSKSAAFYTFYIGKDSKAKETMQRLASTIKGTTYAYTLNDEKGNLADLFNYLSISITQKVEQATDGENDILFK